MSSGARGRGGVQGAHSRALRGPGQRLLLDGAPVGRRGHRSARHAHRPRPGAQRVRERPPGRRRPTASFGCRGSDVFDTVLVANRGEIAVRVISTLRTHGHSIGRRLQRRGRATRATCARPTSRCASGPSAARESYLNIERVLDAPRRVARRRPCIPGTDSSRRTRTSCAPARRAGVVFIGPSAESVEMMGDKIRAKAAVARGGGRASSPDARTPHGRSTNSPARPRRSAIPVLVKPSAGGGGKGMRLVHAPDGPGRRRSSRLARESAASFGDDTLFIERYVESPRHIEVQILVDNFGHARAPGRARVLPAATSPEGRSRRPPRPCSSEDVASRR